MKVATPMHFQYGPKIIRILKKFNIIHNNNKNILNVSFFLTAAFLQFETA